jgi:hypothetical protein
MNIFYIVATFKDSLGGNKAVLAHSMESDWESYSLEMRLLFTNKTELLDFRHQMALFTPAELEILMNIKNKAIYFQSELINEITTQIEGFSSYLSKKYFILYCKIYFA